MAAAQLIAARAAGVAEIVYHSLDEDGVHALEKGRRLAEAIVDGSTIDEVVATLDTHGFVWGRSDGN